MKLSETSAAVGYNHGIDDLPLDHLEKQAVLEWFARRLWVILENSRPDGPDWHHKTYDPLIIDGNVAHSYVFNLGDGGRHHDIESLEDLERRLVDEATSDLLYRHRGVFTCGVCGREYPDLNEAHYERQYWWCKDCASISDGKLTEFPVQGKLIPKTIMTERMLVCEPPRSLSWPMGQY